MYQDHPDNILGVNNSNNLFDSSAVTANADGSQIERQEYIQQQIAALSGSLPGNFAWSVAPAGTSSTTVVVIAALAGYGDDYFNDDYYMQILKNANSAGNAPEKQVRKITDYVSATGTFTCDAFSAAIEANDICLILHESVVALGRNDSNNVYDSSSVAANEDGSELERMEDLKDRINTIDDLVDTEIAAIKTETDKLPGFISGGGIGSGIARKTVEFSNNTVDIPLFTVTGDVIIRLVAVCGANVVSAGGANIGVDAGSTALIAETDCTHLAEGEIWHDNSPDSPVELLSVIKEYILANGTDIVLDIQSEKQVDSGTISFYCFWTALSSNGAVAASA